jgi:hypothetical protein
MSASPNTPESSLVKLDRDDRAGDAAFDRAGEAGKMREPQVGRAEDHRAEPGAKHQDSDIGEIAGRSRRKADVGRPREPHERQPGRQPGEGIEGRVDERAVHLLFDPPNLAPISMFAA